MATIEIERDFGGLTDHLRSYAVIIDGAVVGRLRPGESDLFAVAAGSHEVFLKIDWCRSEAVTVHLAEGQTARLRCAGRANAFTGFYWITFGRRRYIELTQATA